MPLLKEFVSGAAKIVLWRRSETAQELLSQVSLTECESNYYQQLNTERRRSEWLAWHLLVKNLFHNQVIEISYDATGAPMLNVDYRVAVSHGGELVGIAVARQACGIDIEPLNRDFSRVKNRILNQHEITTLAPLADIAQVEAIGWCMKECAFKIGRLEGIDFLNDIIITEVNQNEHSAVVDFKRFGKINIIVEIIDNHIICYGTAKENI